MNEFFNPEDIIEVLISIDGGHNPDDAVTFKTTWSVAVIAVTPCGQRGGAVQGGALDDDSKSSVFIGQASALAFLIVFTSCCIALEGPI